MKTPLLLLAIHCLALVSCGPSPIPASYRIQFPRLPVYRTELLGKNCWRLEYYDSSGNFRQKEVPGNSTKVEIDILQKWPNAVLAWPYWPEPSIGQGAAIENMHGTPPGALAAGLFFPAGAVFPLDAAGETIILSWEAGVEAFFYRELDKAQGYNTGTNRAPEYFDWKRFRTLIRENEDSELRHDPWLADWKDIAERTVRSGFRQSYVRKEARTGMEITVPHRGPWLSASPFRPPHFWELDENVTLFLSARPEVYVCPGGRLSVSSLMLLWVPFP